MPLTSEEQEALDWCKSIFGRRLIVRKAVPLAVWNAACSLYFHLLKRITIAEIRDMEVEVWTDADEERLSWLEDELMEHLAGQDPLPDSLVYEHGLLVGRLVRVYKKAHALQIEDDDEVSS